MKLKDAVGKRVEDLLKDKNFTQYGLGKLGGISRQTINTVVKCQHKNLALDTVYQIVATLGISLKEFFDDPMFDDISD